MSTDDRTRKRLGRILGRPRAAGTQEISDRAPDDPSPTAGAAVPSGDHEGDGAAELRKRIVELRLQIDRIAARRREPASRRDQGPRDSRWPVRSWPGDGAGPDPDPAPPLPGGRVPGPHGPAWVRQITLEPGSTQGLVALDSALAFTSDDAVMMSLDHSLAGFDPRAATFLDIETTGLSMGTGTIAFLAGLGWFDDRGGFVVRQLFVDGLESEKAVLAELESCVSKRPCLVTFNGKTFDVPVLRARLVLSRIAFALGESGHLDLLHVARRIWKRRVGDCSLDSLERSVLGFYREGDIPGELIPEIFVHYLRTGRTGRMHGVFHHNLLDVITMAALLGRLADLSARASAGGGGEHPSDLVSLARVGLRGGYEEGARSIFEGTSSAPSPDHRVESLLTLARLARSRGELDAERDLLERAVRDDPDCSIAHLRLAKLFEHRLRDRALALEHAKLCGSAEPPEAHERRLVRLLSPSTSRRRP